MPGQELMDQAWYTLMYFYIAFMALGALFTPLSYRYMKYRKHKLDSRIYFAISLFLLAMGTINTMLVYLFPDAASFWYINVFGDKLYEADGETLRQAWYSVFSTSLFLIIMGLVFSVFSGKMKNKLKKKLVRILAIFSIILGIVKLTVAYIDPAGAAERFLSSWHGLI